MYQPSERMKSLEQHLQPVLTTHSLQGMEKPGSSAWYLSKAYEIHQHRLDQTSEAACIAAFHYFAAQRLPNTIPGGIQEWTKSEIDSFPNRNPLPKHISQTPWTSVEDHVYVKPTANNPCALQYIAGCVDQTKFQFKIGSFLSLTLRKREQEHASKNNATLIAAVPDLVHNLQNAQDVLLQNMDRIASNRPHSFAPHIFTTAEAINQTLTELQPQIESSTPGPWHYDPNTFLVSAPASIGKTTPITFLSNPNERHSPEKLREIHANGQLMAMTPTVIKQLTTSRDALFNAHNALVLEQTSTAFYKLHTAALQNHSVLQEARGEHVNPLTLTPQPGTPGLDKWIEANLEIINAIKKIPGWSYQPKYCVPEQESGIYCGPIAAQTNDSYVQLRNDGTAVAHWKGSFEHPPETGKTYTISYNQEKATAREKPSKQLETTTRER